MRLALTIGLFCLLQWAQAVLLGVDLGSEFSKAILVAPNVQFDLLLTPESKRKGLAGVAAVPNEDLTMLSRKYGSDAMPQCSKDPRFCFFGVKDILNGCDQHSIDLYRKTFPGTDVALMLNRTVYVLSREKSRQASLYPEEILGMQLREIKQRALEHWKEASFDTYSKDGEITELVLSVPRYFNEIQRKSLRDSAELAGMKIVSLVDDGLAIGLDFAQKMTDLGEDVETYLVLDIGASASKATLIGLSNVNETINLETLGYGYDTEINGHEFTRVVRDLILNQFSTEQKVPLNELFANSKLLRRVWTVAEKTKLVLSANSEAKVNIESLYEDIDFKMVLTREMFENAISGKVKQNLKSILDSSLGDSKSDIKGIILAGGSFRVPIIQSTLKDYFGSDELFLKSVNADESVVFGTTLKGAAIKGLMRKKKINIVDHDLHTHEIKSLNNNKESSMVKIESGMVADEPKILNLTSFNHEYNPHLLFDVFTDDKLSQNYNFTLPKRLSDCDDYQYFLQYKYDSDELFTINNVKIKCFKTGQATPKTGNLIKVSNIQGLAPATKISLNEKLNTIDTKDEELRNRTEIINQIESLIYETRYLLDDNEENIEPKYVEQLSQLLSKSMEWLEDHSENSTMDQLVINLHEMEKAIKVINVHVSLRDWDSAMETLETIFTEVQTSFDETLRLIERIDSSESKLMDEIKERGLDYVQMTSMLAGSSKPDMTPINSIKEFVQELQELLELIESVDADGYNYLLKDGWIDLIVNAHIKLEILKNFKTQYKTTWDNRSGFINHQLAELRSAEEKERRKQKRAQKQKEIEDAIEMKEAEEKEGKMKDEEVVEKIDDGEKDDIKADEIIVDHDEL